MDERRPPLRLRQAPASAGAVQVEAGRSVLSTTRSRLLGGVFSVAFDDERFAQAAARECRIVGFVSDVTEGVDGGWVLSLRRKGLFPADERDRYASRLQRIVDPHQGRYEAFVPDQKGST